MDKVYLQKLYEFIDKLSALAEAYEMQFRLPDVYGLMLEDYSDPFGLARFRAAVYHSPRLEKFGAIVEWLINEEDKEPNFEVEGWYDTQAEAMEHAAKAVKRECRMSAQRQEKGTIPFEMV